METAGLTVPGSSALAEAPTGSDLSPTGRPLTAMVQMPLPAQRSAFSVFFQMLSQRPYLWKENMSVNNLHSLCMWLVEIRPYIPKVALVLCKINAHKKVN